MDALMASYASSDSGSDTESEHSPSHVNSIYQSQNSNRNISEHSPSHVNSIYQSQNSNRNVESLPPPPLDLLKPPNFIDLSTTPRVRIRSFPHVEGNYALHVYIPVRIPSATIKQIAYYVKKVSSSISGLHIVDVDIELSELCKDNHKLEQILLGREFHISLGRTVPILVHQIDSIVAMLRQNFRMQRGYCIEFNKWEVFTNDDLTRTFLSLEITGGGLSEICKQIQIVDDIYKLHGLPEFYKDPRPHISLVWALGDISKVLKQVVTEVAHFHYGPSVSSKHVLMCNFSGIECKIGKKMYNICKIS